MAQDKLRRQIAWEAARLMYEQHESFHRATMHAAKRLAGRWIHPKRLPSHREIRAEIEKMSVWHDATDHRLLPTPREADRFEAYHRLLAPLADVRLSPKHHPEGDALYHSLQVFTLARSRLPSDEEFLLAALLHDVGRAIDPRDHVSAALDALGEFATERCLWLIEHSGVVLVLFEGSLGSRARRRLEASEHFDELMLLAECDRQGRVAGAETPEMDDALEYIRDLADMCGE